MSEWPKTVGCGYCHGTGWEPSALTTTRSRCPSCDGAGRLYVSGPAHPIPFDQFNRIMRERQARP